MSNKSIYYDINETLTHNCLFNFVCGNRSGGKTYGFKKWAIQDWIKNKRQFGYIRRYETEVDGKKLESFFNDVGQEFPEWDFKVDGRTFYIRKRSEAEKNPNHWECIGHCFVLSKAMTYKSVPYPFINKLLFDEFLIEKGTYRYLTNEVDKFLDLYVTIARPGSGHIDVIVFFMANAISFTNMYFLKYDIKEPAPGKRFFKPKKFPEVLLQMVGNESMIERQKNTRFGSIISGTKYEEYAFENKFYLDDNTFIEKKSDMARYLFTMNYRGEQLGVWVDYNEGIMYCSEKIDPYCKAIYALTQQDHKPNTLLIKNINKGVYLKQFIECYKEGNVRFETMKAKNLCYEIIKMIMMR